MYDGYHGQHAADLTQTYLHHFIKQEIETESNSLTEPPHIVVGSPNPETKERNMESEMVAENPPDIAGPSRRDGNVLSSYSVLRACRNGYKLMDDYLSWGVHETSKYINV